jgi:hypothetical protein
MLALQTEGHRDWTSRPLLDQLHTLNALRRTYGTVHLIEFALASKRADLDDLDTYYRRMAAESRKPVRQRASVPLPRAWWWQENARILGGDQAWEWEVSATDFALLEVALAVRLHRLEHGSYPARLSEISPRWLPSVPLDTWDQPIVYRSEHGRPVIYSLGPDGKDDGGTPVSQLTLHPETHGDLVFGALAPRQRLRAAGRR